MWIVAWSTRVQLSDRRARRAACGGHDDDGEADRGVGRRASDRQRATVDRRRVISSRPPDTGADRRVATCGYRVAVDSEAHGRQRSIAWPLRPGRQRGAGHLRPDVSLDGTGATVGDASDDGGRARRSRRRCDLSRAGGRGRTSAGERGPVRRTAVRSIGPERIFYPKRHLADTALALALAGVDAGRLQTDPTLAGRYLESYVLARLRP